MRWLVSEGQENYCRISQCPTGHIDIGILQPWPGDPDPVRKEQPGTHPRVTVQGHSIHQSTISLLIHRFLLDPSCIPTSQLLLQTAIGVRSFCDWTFDSVDSEEITKDTYCCECSKDLTLVDQSSIEF